MIDQRGKRSFLSAGLVCVLAACGSTPDKAPAPVPADRVVWVSALIPYKDGEAAPQAFRDECKWEKAMPDYMAENSEGRVKVERSGGNPNARRKLSLATQTLHMIGGGFYTGPKWLVIDGTLSEAGHVVGSFEARRQSYRGSMGARTTVSEFSEDLAEDVIDWLQQAPAMNDKPGDAK